MRRTASVLFAAALTLGAIAATDDGQTGGEETLGSTETPDPDHPCYDEDAEALVYPEQRVWFEEGESKVGNTAETPHPWGTTAPEASVQDGAGAGQLSLTASQDATQPTATMFEGTFTGCIDTMLFDLYSFDPTNRTSIGNVEAGNPGEPSPHVLALRITVDGLENVVSLTDVEVATEFANGAMGPNLNRFAVNLGDRLERYSDRLGGPLDGEHTVTVEVAPWYLNTGAASIYVWDTTEVPSGITFNGEVTEDYPTVN